jgi:hypothetical protein
MRVWLVCERCGNDFSWDEAGSQPSQCAVCLHLGDRSLVGLLRDVTPDSLERFRNAPPGWLRAQRETGSPVLPRRYEVREDPNHMTKG